MKKRTNLSLWIRRLSYKIKTSKNHRMLAIKCEMYIGLVNKLLHFDNEIWHTKHNVYISLKIKIQIKYYITSHINNYFIEYFRYITRNIRNCAAGTAAFVFWHA